MPRLLFIRKAADVSVGIPVTNLMAKALNTSRLVKKRITYNRGGKTVTANKWVRPGEASPPVAGVGKADPEEARGSKHGYGMHRIENGDKIAFMVNGERISATVTDDNRKDGVIATDHAGKEYPVEWKDIIGFVGSPGSGGRKEPPSYPVVGPKEPEFIDPEKFNAHEWKAEYDDPSASAQSILDEMEKVEPGTKKAIEITERRLKTLEETIGTYRVEGKDAAAVYTGERERLHEKIIGKLLSPERIAAATPAKGEQPVFIMLGGRGGSGKSWFDKKVYDSTRCIVLDADEIKKELPGYEGWNAFQVHEESSDILEMALSAARDRGLNVVLDATMKTTKSAMKKIEFFKEAGYSFEAHYMHLPRQEAAKRAVSRFMGKTKRYVPVEVVLGNTTNEASFDEAKKYADAWSFRDNNVEMGHDPILVSEKGKRRFSDLLKALLYRSMTKGLYSGRRQEMKATIERKDAWKYDEYDNGDVTPDDKLSPFVRKQIARIADIQEGLEKERASEDSK